jgi:siroheme synthase
MPGQNYAEISKRLLGAGMSGDTACAVISRATTKYQRTHRTTVFELHRAPQLVSPTLLVVGDVVRLADPAAAVDGFISDASAPESNLLPTTHFEGYLAEAPPVATDETTA